MSVFEALMMIFFGAAWPFSIYKSYNSKSNKGKSLLFLIVVLLGYTFGIIHKILYSFDNVIVLYILNFVLIFVDCCLYFRNKAISSRNLNK